MSCLLGTLSNSIQTPVKFINLFFFKSNAHVIKQWYNGDEKSQDLAILFAALVVLILVDNIRAWLRNAAITRFGSTRRILRRRGSNKTRRRQFFKIHKLRKSLRPPANLTKSNSLGILTPIKKWQEIARIVPHYSPIFVQFIMTWLRTTAIPRCITTTRKLNRFNKLRWRKFFMQFRNLRKALRPPSKPKKSNSLGFLAQMKKWQELAEMAPHYKEELYVKGAGGCLPLHMACSHSDSIPCYVLRALLEAAGDATKRADDNGRLPLHWLLRNGSPEAGVLQTLIEASPEALAARDAQGCTPLSLAVENDISPNKFKIMLEYLNHVAPTILQPGQNTNEDDDPLVLREKTPLYLIWKKFFSRNHSSIGSQTSFKKKGNCWEKAMLLLKAAYSYRVPTAKFHSFHAFLEFYAYLPPEISDFLFPLASHRLEPEEGTLRLPLHIAASIDAPDYEVNYLITDLLCIHPESAAIKAANGRLPFHEALAAGKTWDMDSVQSLLEAYPSALTTPDAVTGLHPFMIAASSSTSASASSVTSNISGTLSNTHSNGTDSIKEPMKLMGDEDLEEFSAQEETNSLESSFELFRKEENLNLTTVFEIIRKDPAAVLHDW